jgi:hypothetical protein
MARLPSLRSAIAHLALAALALSLLAAFVVTGSANVKTVWLWAPQATVDASLSWQVRRVRTLLPPLGSIAYCQRQHNAWVAGIWQRELLPDHTVLIVHNQADLDAARRQYMVNHILVAGLAPDWLRFRPLATLPAFAGGEPTVMGELQ